MLNKHNAFDLLMATGVLINYRILLGGYSLTDPLDAFSKGQSNLADLSVMGFFTLSGFLITGSFDRTKNLVLFASHRILRIVPGFLASLLIAGLGLVSYVFIERPFVRLRRYTDLVMTSFASF